MATKQATSKPVEKGVSKKTSNDPVKENTSVVIPREPRVNNIYKEGKGLHFRLENIEVISNNLDRPYHNTRFEGQESWSSSARILLTPKIKEEIYKLLADHFSREAGLNLALTHFLTKKIKDIGEGKQILFASVNWKKENGKLRLSKPLPITHKDGMGDPRFPFSFEGSVQIGFSYSMQHTFACYLNGVIIDKVIAWGGSFGGMQSDSNYDPEIPVDENGDDWRYIDAGQENSKKSETADSRLRDQEPEKKKSKFNFWKK